MEVVTIVSGCEGDGELVSDFDQPLIQERLVFNAIVLNLNIKSVRTKDHFDTLRQTRIALFISPLAAWTATSPLRHPLRAISPRGIG